MKQQRTQAYKQTIPTSSTEPVLSSAEALRVTTPSHHNPARHTTAQPASITHKPHSKGVLFKDSQPALNQKGGSSHETSKTQSFRPVPGAGRRIHHNQPNNNTQHPRKPPHALQPVRHQPQTNPHRLYVDTLTHARLRQPRAAQSSNPLFHPTRLRTATLSRRRHPPNLPRVRSQVHPLARHPRYPPQPRTTPPPMPVEQYVDGVLV